MAIGEERVSISFGLCLEPLSEASRMIADFKNVAKRELARVHQLSNVWKINLGLKCLDDLMRLGAPFAALGAPVGAGVSSVHRA